MARYANRLAAAVLAAALAGCEGEIGSGPKPTPVEPGTYDPTFACAGADPAVPTTIARLPKVQWVNSIDELFSTLSASHLAAVRTKLADHLALLPGDSATEDSYSVADSRLSQEHVDAVFDVAATLAAELAANDAYVADL